MLVAERHQHHVWCKPGAPCWPTKTDREKHQHGPFCGHYTAAAVRWWLARSPREDEGKRQDYYTHFGALLDLGGGRSMDDTEALDWCYRATVLAGGGDMHGNLCICLRGDPPSAGEARGSIGGDGSAALTATIADLDHAADELPICWSTTQQIFETQQRTGVYRARLLAYRRNLNVRDIDRWQEPRSPGTRALTHYMMAMTLGGARTECALPSADSPLFGATAFMQRELLQVA